MTPARLAQQRPPQAKVLAIDACGNLSHRPRAQLVDLFREHDLLIANDAAVLPAGLFGTHESTGRPIEVRLAGRQSLSPESLRRPLGVVFGAGDFRTRTEDRPLPPVMAQGDGLALGPLHGRVEAVLDHPRLIRLAFDGSLEEIWEGLARHGRPIQYAHVATPLALWDVWSAIAGPPVAFEPPSAGFALDWNLLAALKERNIGFATLSHAAGLSSTGDPQLDARFPLDEPYWIPAATAAAIAQTQSQGGRIIAVGTTVVRALEHAAQGDGRVLPGPGLATQRIGAATRLRVVDAILSGTHEPDTSHYQLLRAFADDLRLRRMEQELNARDYRTHEFGDSVLLERASTACPSPAQE